MSLTNKMQNLKVKDSVLPKGTTGQQIMISTNAYELKLRNNMPVFKYDVRFYEVFSLSTGEEKRKELCKQTRDDFTEVERKTKSVLLLRYLAGKKLPDLQNLAYDRAASLFSLKKFDNIIERLPMSVVSTIEGYVFDETIEGVDVEIKNVSDSFQASTNDISSGNSNEILEYLNLLTSQIGFHRQHEFIAFGNSRFFPLRPETFNLPSEPQLTHGMSIGIGCMKSVRITDGNKPAIVLDITKSAFHNDDQTLVSKIQACFMQNNVAELLKQQSNIDAAFRIINGLVVYTTHLGRRVEYKVKGFGRPAGSETFDVNGVRKTVAQYFRETYNLSINPNLPVIRLARIVLPMDLLFVAGNQRASKQALQGKNQTALIKSGAAKPHNRLAQTSMLSQALQIDGRSQNEFFSAAGAQITPGAIQLSARVLPAPHLVIAGKQSAMSKYDPKEPITVSGHLKQWAVYLTPEPNCTPQYREKYDTIRKATVAKGVKLPAPVEVAVFTGPNVEDCFRKEKARNTQFILFITSPSVNNHAEIKLYERKYNILSQQINGKTALNAEVTANIAHKINTKTGGLSWSIPNDAAMLTDNLVIGIEFTHPPPSNSMPSEPSVLGWSANIVQHAQSFTGSFCFIQPRKSDDVANIEASLRKIISFTVERFIKLRTKPPKKILIYRNGASEGQYKTILHQEISILNDAISAVNKGAPIPIVYVAVAKVHNHRFYSRRGDNVPCGTVVDTGIVSAQTNEFFLNGHVAIQGTARAPKYTIIVNGDDGKLMSMDQIEQLTYNLQYLHQICAATPALPVMLRIASECAKRGASNYRQMFGFEVTAEKIELANTRLDYCNSGLINIRYNA